MKARSSYIDLVSVSTVLALTLFGAAAFAQTPALRANGKIAFTSDRDGNREIYLMNPDGTSQVRLTNNSVIDDHPVWSPKGNKIAFLSQNASSGFSIFVMNADGTGKTEITPVIYQSPSTWFGFDGWSMTWSPDGGRIVFVDAIPNASTIAIVNADGSDRHDLTSGFYPAWSPDGSKILFERFGSPSPFYNLYSVLPDGSGVRSIPIFLQDFFVLWDSPVTWSPDGHKIAFNVFDGANNEIDTADAEGTNPQFFVSECAGVVPNGCSVTLLPAWSPDGKTIAFINRGSSGAEIYEKSTVGGDSTQLTDTAGNNSNPNWQPISKMTTDFDGDGRSDISVFRPSDGVWYLDRSTQGFSAAQFGLSTDTITPADYDGDGKTDIAVYRDGTWWRINSSNSTVAVTQFGSPTDIPVPADYIGDGRAELAVYRGGTWWMLNPVNNQISVVQFGIVGDKPIPADYDGDGRVDQAVYRGDGEWHLNRSSQGYIVVNFGNATDKPVVGDYDGDGAADPAVFRNGTWYLLQSTHGFTSFKWGFSADIPSPADFDGDGRTDAAVYRNGVWYLLQSTGGPVVSQFGLANDEPVPAAYLH